MRAARVVPLAASLVLLWLALAYHPVGDYFTESDFYGGYVHGARLIQHGRMDPTRYPVVGPGYDVAIALLGFVIPDLFLAAKLVSVLAALAVLVCFFLLVERRFGAAAAFWTALVVALNPVWVLYGYSATTDLLAAGLCAGSIFALLAARGRRGPLVAGGLAALATLTRYNMVSLVPASLACLAWLERPAGLSRRTACARYLAGFAAVAIPWTAFALGRGAFPGENLFRNFGFYLNQDSSRNIQDAFGSLTGSMPSTVSFLEQIRRDAPGLALRTLANVPDHLEKDLRELLGLPVAGLAVAGLAAAWAARVLRRLAPLALLGAGFFASLTPIFWSDRYCLPLIPIYAVSAGLALGLPLPGWASRRWVWLVRAAVGLATFCVMTLDTVDVQRIEATQLPLDVLQAGRVLHDAAPRGARVMSRKGHIGFYSGLDVVPFPRVASLPELGDFARERGVSFLYFSWYEGKLRPEFWYLLDSTATFPGLTRLFYTEMRPAALYRVGPEFGREPAWFSNDTLVQEHTALAAIKVLPDSSAWPYHVRLAAIALNRGDPPRALEQAEAAARGHPDRAMTWIVGGEALRRMGRPRGALTAFEKAAALEPDNVVARVGIGRSLLALGRDQEAAQTFRPVVSASRNPAALREMVILYERLGDEAAAQEALAALARVSR